jgi:PAS domain S-box-containing protein
MALQLAHAVALARTVGRVSESEERFRELAETIREVFFISGPSGSPMLYVTPFYEEIWGQSRERLYADPRAWIEAIHPEDRRRVMEDYRRLPADLDQEYRIVRPDGAVKWLHSRSFAVRDDKGGVLRLVGIAEDITRRKGAEEALRERANLAEFNAAVNAALSEGGDLREMLHRCTEEMVRRLDAAFARIWTLNENENVLELQVSAGMYTHTDGGHSRIPVGAFKIGLIAQERKPHLTNRVVGDPRVHDQEWAKRQGMVAFAGYPLIVEERLVGVMAMFARKELSESTMQALASVAKGIALGIRRKRAEEEVRKNLERIRALHEIDLAITSSLDLDRVLSVLLEKIDVFFPYETASTVRLLEPGTNRLEYTASRNLNEEDWRKDTIVTAGGRGKEIMEGKRPLVVRNLQTDPRTRHRPFYGPNRLVSYLGVPLISQDAVLGILSLYTRQERDFNEDEIDFLATLAGQGAIAIHNAQLLREAQERAEEQVVLATIAQATSQSLSLNDVLNLAMDAVLQLTKRDKGYIRLKDPVSGEVTLAVQRGISEDYAETLLHHRTPGGKTDQVLNAGASLVVNDPVNAVLKEATLREGTGCVAWIPIEAGGRPIGVLNISDSRAVPFRQREVEVLEAVGHIIGIAVENSRLFERTKEQAETLARANRVKDDFLSVMSHELRTPLNVVMGYAAMMKDGLLGEVNAQQSDALQKVLERADEQLAMINNVLSATVFESHEPVIEREELSLARFLDQLKAEYDTRLVADGLTLRWDYPGDLPAIRTDAAKLRIILQNLIGNAIKFTGKGTVTVSARLLPIGGEENRGAGVVEFKVADTGIGIAEDQLPFIFDKFHQADSSQTRSYGGVGMGLYIVKQFAELLGGAVKVKSERDRGSTFSVTLPFGG